MQAVHLNSVLDRGPAMFISKIVYVVLAHGA
jgi:hypothetical protein